jgi:hypothetical protein
MGDHVKKIAVGDHVKKIAVKISNKVPHFDPDSAL